MKRGAIFLIFFMLIHSGKANCKLQHVNTGLLTGISNCQDSPGENPILYNGRVWRNLYSMVRDNQFLFSGEPLPGTVSINGQTFSNLTLKYDIYKDELLTPIVLGPLLQLNKEMVDSFSIFFQNKTYRFTNLPQDSLKDFNGYMNVLASGKASLFIRYKKEIDNLAVDDKYDLFFQTQKIYVVKEGSVYTVANKRDLVTVLDERKDEIRSYIKMNRLRISKKDPENFIPVIRFYNSIHE